MGSRRWRRPTGISGRVTGRRTTRSSSAPPHKQGARSSPGLGGDLDEVLCEQYERTVGADNCVSFEGKSLQIPRGEHRCHYVKAKVRVRRYLDGSLGVFHGPRQLAGYDGEGRPRKTRKKRKGGVAV